jgi:hypothetical protein
MLVDEVHSERVNIKFERGEFGSTQKIFAEDGHVTSFRNLRAESKMPYNNKNYARSFGGCHGGGMSAMAGITELPREVYITSIGWVLPEMIDEIIACNLDFVLMDITDLNKKIMIILSKASYKVLRTLNMNREELKRRVEKIMLIESAVSAFKDMAPEQAKKLDE